MMKKLLTIGLCVLPLVAVAKGGAHKLNKITNTAPCVDDDNTDCQKLSGSFESDSYTFENTEYVSPSLIYSYKGWDVGLADQNTVINGSGGAQNFQNDLYINVAHTVKYKDILYRISNDWANMLSFVSTTIGTQDGTVVPFKNSVAPNQINSKTLHEYYFVDTDFEFIKDRLTVHLGPYWANAALTTTTSYFGYETGIELFLLPKHLKFNFDWGSGQSNVSGGTAQLTYIHNKHFELFGGMGIAAHNSGNYNYALCGFNVIDIIK